MKFDRSKFKKADLTEVKKTMASAEQTMYQSRKGYTQFISVVEGSNVFRILPSLEPPTYAPLKISKLPVEVDVYDENGNITGREVKQKNIFCADVHGKNLLKGKDPIMTYISYVYAKAEEIQDETEKKKFLAPITGFRNKKKEFVWGINPSLSYVCYVLTASGDIAKLQLRSQWMKRIQEISLEMSEDEVVNLDMFSGPDDGYPLKIMARKDGAKMAYSLSAVTPKRGAGWEEFFEENAVSDAVLQELQELPSLKELYVECYSKRDFDWAIEGLKRIDEENDYGVFEDDAFLNEIEEMAEMIPDPDEDPEVSDDSEEEEEVPAKKKPVTKKSNPTTAKPKAATKAKEIEKFPPLSKMKAELREYIEAEYEGEEELPDLSITEIREWYKLMKEERPLPFEDYREEEEEEEEVPQNEEDYSESDDNEDESDNSNDEEEEEETPAPQKASSSITEESKAKIRNLRAKFGKKA